MRVFEYQLLNNGNMNGNITTAIQPLTQMYLASIQAVWTGSPVGSLSILLSNDQITWTTYTGSATAVSGAGDFMWLLGTVPFPYLKVFYSFSSGTGSLNVSINGKGPS